jgi:ABC-type branched-subunit amino acid transport system substrate-binding protein/class 3 adenylate cyclase
MEGSGERDRGPIPSDSATRGFFFSDLRGYTEFVEAHGAVAAAELLGRYRTLMRSEIQRFGGAEIKTEGDSFYVVFGSVTTAVRCGLAVTAAAREAAREDAAAPIRVGIGIHAGETFETDEGFVGSPVNIAARICSKAGPGEVLVSETVRALTRTLLPVEFQPRGRPRLKGVADTIQLYAVVERTGAVAAGRRRSRRPARRVGLFVGGAAVAALLLAGAGWSLTRPGPGLPLGPWKIGVSLPLTGSWAAGGIPLRLAVQQAIDDVNAAGGIGGAKLELAAYDDAGPPPYDEPDPDLALANMRALADDDRVVGVVGPYGADVAAKMVRAGNESGLVICGPASTSPELTKDALGAADLRSARPNHRAFVRIAPSDDIQTRAMASFARRDLGATRVLVIDDGGNLTFLAEGFATEFTKLGGQVERRTLNYLAGAEPKDVIRAWTVGPGAPDAVFWAGETATGGAALRVAMNTLDHASTPLLSWDGLNDGSGYYEGSFIRLTGAGAANTYATHASLPLAQAGFAERYRQAFGREPDEYSAAGHACTQVILAALRDIAANGVTADGLREAVRAKVVEPARRYQTVLGTIGFDANGDSLQQFVTFYRVDPSANGGLGEWVIMKQQDFGPAS